MRIIVVGATGTIGSAVVEALAGHDVIPVTRTHTPIAVELSDPLSIHAMYEQIGTVDAVVSAAGLGVWKPLSDLGDEDFVFALRNKLMGQVNLIRHGFAKVRDGGSITVTSGILARKPMSGSGAVSLVNAGLEGFVRAAALEAPRGIRVNIVSPPWVTETLVKLGMDQSHGLTAATVARSYVESINGSQTGQVIEPRG